jgi:hypothetical protein
MPDPSNAPPDRFEQVQNRVVLDHSKSTVETGGATVGIGNSIKELTLPLSIRFSALQQLLLLRCRKVSQAGVPGEVNCGAAVLAALPLPDLPGPEVAKGNLRAARPAQVFGSTGCGRGAPANLPPPVLSTRVQLCLAPEGRL